MDAVRAVVPPVAEPGAAALPVLPPTVVVANLSDDLMFDLRFAFERMYELPGDIYLDGDTPRKMGYLPESLLRRLKKELGRPDLMEGARVYEQHEGFMVPHKDTAVHSVGTHTFIFYLSDCEGGTLCFEDGFPDVLVRAGTCVGFAKHITHWTTPITSGFKRCIICDY